MCSDVHLCFVFAGGSKLSSSTGEDAFRPDGTGSSDDEETITVANAQEVTCRVDVCSWLRLSLSHTLILTHSLALTLTVSPSLLLPRMHAHRLAHSLTRARTHTHSHADFLTLCHRLYLHVFHAFAVQDDSRVAAEVDDLCRESEMPLDDFLQQYIPLDYLEQREKLVADTASDSYSSYTSSSGDDSTTDDDDEEEEEDEVSESAENSSQARDSDDHEEEVSATKSRRGRRLTRRSQRSAAGATEEKDAAMSGDSDTDSVQSLLSDNGNFTEGQIG